MTLIQSYWKSNWKNVLDEIKKRNASPRTVLRKSAFRLLGRDFQEPLSLNIGSEKRTLSYQYHVQPSRFEEIEFYFLPGKYKLSL
ncbi:hypothetical protein LEP1GSC018_3331 [Leptospira kirschneri str. 2008720114]|uniref:hypothetical protein n=1 Tax=Leptospira kirschneri TaxID=29507 RepID=UPI0002982030|nr:hypothetical protein [Leptospira kirschneri]EKP03360.1 hypothetical protein LEP1GSC018_3331 [Leptospira kirschneri str. 2008720114]